MANQQGCGATVLYSDAERLLLERAAGDGAREVSVLNWCVMEAGHPGDLHCALGQWVDAVSAWWMRFTLDGEVHDLRLCARCDDDRGTGCLLFHGHDGGHRRETVLGESRAARAPILLPEEVETESLSPEQRANQYRLHRDFGLTPAVYLQMLQLAACEQSMGVSSTQHLAVKTTEPAAQVSRCDATTPGLAAAVAQEYLEVLPVPPYEPYTGYRSTARTVAVQLTARGRVLLERLETAFPA